jgi:hypothetical protein
MVLVVVVVVVVVECFIGITVGGIERERKQTSLSHPDCGIGNTTTVESDLPVTASKGQLPLASTVPGSSSLSKA